MNIIIVTVAEVGISISTDVLVVRMLNDQVRLSSCYIFLCEPLLYPKKMAESCDIAK